MDIKFLPGVIKGSVEAISSEAELQRIMIASALCGEKTVISYKGISQQAKLTADCLNCLGADVSVEESRITVEPVNPDKASSQINCADNTLLLRFLLPVAASFGLNVKFTSSASPVCRPVIPLRNEMKSNGVSFSPPWKYPLEISGKLESGEFNFSGAMGSQYATGLLLALPTVKGNSVIHLDEELKSKSYIDMTLKIIEKFGIEIIKQSNCLYIKGEQKYISPKEISVGGDWLSSAYLFAAGAVSGEVSIKGLDLNTHQPEVKILDILKNFGANVEIASDEITVRKSVLKGTAFDASEIYNLVPALVSLGAYCQSGLTIISNIPDYQINGRNASAVFSDCLCAIGGASAQTDDGLIVWSGENIVGGEISSYDDFRIVMAAASAASDCKREITVKNTDCINKINPQFLNNFKKLGGVLNVINN